MVFQILWAGKVGIQIAIILGSNVGCKTSSSLNFSYGIYQFELMLLNACWKLHVFILLHLLTTNVISGLVWPWKYCNNPTILAYLNKVSVRLPNLSPGSVSVFVGLAFDFSPSIQIASKILLIKLVFLGQFFSSFLIRAPRNPAT